MYANSGLQTLFNITGLRSFHSLNNVFRHFVPNFARIAAPLNQGLQSIHPYIYTALPSEDL